MDSERRATLLAIFVTFGCLGFFILVIRPARQPSRTPIAFPAATPLPSLEPPPPLASIQKFLAVPGRWASVDFKHYNYGIYKFSGGGKISLRLKNGEYPTYGDNSRGWFTLNDVYYFDVTGDSIPEAIVDLLHVECGPGSCDDGSQLIFIYSINANGRVKQLFRFETGSYAYGCGLKSVTLKWKAVDLELFGHCEPPAMNDSGRGKFIVKDITQLSFRFSDKGFIPTETKTALTDLIDVKSCRPEIRIVEEPGYVIR